MDEGIDYRYYEDQSLQELFRHMKSLAQIILKYHQKGYLHLDIKPENVLILPETPEHVILFDFDSVTAIGELQKMQESLIRMDFLRRNRCRENQKNRISFRCLFHWCYAVF